MLLRITHRTEYSYDAPVPYALQRLRLVPAEGPTQTVRSWTLSVEGAREELRFQDHFGNDTKLLSVEGTPHAIAIEVGGEVETRDSAGVFGTHRGFAPLWLFCRETPLSAAGEGVRDLVASLPDGSELERLHSLMNAVSARVRYMTGTTSTETSAEEALKLGAGVCQDHSHVFIAAARKMGFPARYVSGYLMMDGTTVQVASHAWAEAHVPGLGWVAFDAANGIAPDGRYVRVATGLDYRDAMPVSGIRLGQAHEQLAVTITVEQ